MPYNYRGKAKFAREVRSAPARAARHRRAAEPCRPTGYGGPKGPMWEFPKIRGTVPWGSL